MMESCCGFLQSWSSGWFVKIKPHEFYYYYLVYIYYYYYYCVDYHGTTIVLTMKEKRRERKEGEWLDGKDNLSLSCKKGEKISWW